MTLFDLHGKVAIVTGGNGGLGRGMALGLAAAGATRLWLTVSGRGAEEQAKYLRILGEQIMRRFL